MDNIQAQNISDGVLLNELSARIEKYKAAVENLNSLNKQLLDLNQKLTESEAMKSHFISNITNEIINPFASILGLSKSIMECPETDVFTAFQPQVPGRTLCAPFNECGSRAPSYLSGMRKGHSRT